MKLTWRILRVLLFAVYLTITVSLLLFSLLEIFPSIIDYLNPQGLIYYALKRNYRPDTILVYSYRNIKHLSVDLRGDLYSGNEGVPVHPIRSEESYNAWEFRINSSVPPYSAAVIGDSFLEYSESDLDTFSERLKALSGLSTFNLGRAGYGPYQYLEVFKRYALPLRPRYAILCFFAGNDIKDMREYRRWLSTGQYYFYSDYSRAWFFHRYHMAVFEVTHAVLYLAQNWWTGSQSAPKPAPNLATFELGNRKVVMKVDYWNEAGSPRQLLSTSPWRELKSLLEEFHRLSIENGITPIVVYIPTKIQVYGRFFTGDGGSEVRAEIGNQLLFETNSEHALGALTRQSDIQFIDLLPAFQVAAAGGKVLYYPFDSHWNREGRELGATLVAAALCSRPPEETVNSRADTKPEAHACKQVQRVPPISSWENGSALGRHASP